MVRRLPLNGDEISTLRASLDRHRAVVLWKVEGLTEEQARRPMTPTGTNLLGLVTHWPAWSTNGSARPTVGQLSPWETDPVADMTAAPHETTEAIVAFYRRACTASDDVVSDLSLDSLGSAWFGETVSLRRVMVGMIEETARHAGHMDILRELIDGATGSHPET